LAAPGSIVVVGTIAERTFVLDRWRKRFRGSGAVAGRLREIAESRTWDRRRKRTLSVARAIYPRLPQHAKLWAGRRELVDLDRGALEAVLGP